MEDEPSTPAHPNSTPEIRKAPISAKSSTLSTPLGSTLVRASFSTGRRNRLALDPNWKEHLKRRRISLQAELEETKVTDSESPAKKWKNFDNPDQPSADPNTFDNLSARVKMKREQLEREEKHQAYIDNLKESIEQWKNGCIAALEDLVAGMRNEIPMTDVMQEFHIPPDILGYNAENEAFE